MKKLILGMMVVMGTLSFGSEHERQGNKFEQCHYNNNSKQEQLVERMGRETSVKIVESPIGITNMSFFRDHNNDRH